MSDFHSSNHLRNAYKRITNTHQRFLLLQTNIEIHLVHASYFVIICGYCMILNSVYEGWGFVNIQTLYYFHLCIWAVGVLPSPSNFGCILYGTLILFQILSLDMLGLNGDVIIQNTPWCQWQTAIPPNAKWLLCYYCHCCLTFCIAVVWPFHTKMPISASLLCPSERRADWICYFSMAENSRTNE